MISEEQKQIIAEFSTKFKKEELIWISGYLYGSATSNSIGLVNDQSTKIDQNISIFYITETGNSKFLSAQISKFLKDKGAKVKAKAIEQYRFNDLPKERNLIIIASTHGEGEIPDSGKKFFDYIQTDIDLSKVNFAVIALGDTNYPLFCQAGVDVDKLLTEKKAKRLAEVKKLDLDFEDHIPDVCQKISSLFGGKTEVTTSVTKKSSNNKYKGTIVNNINLNDKDSDKDTRHIEIEVEDELNYEPGDAIGITPINPDGTKASPRLYSIASSVNEHGNEVHLTVSVVKYKNNDGEFKGLASNYLANLDIGKKVEFYISKNRIFKLPTDDKPIIMVGPGTGVAPFRSFIAERNSRNASGKNWLFFGDRTFKNDFLYQAEWLDYLNSKILTKLDVAFSRDQKEKLYVQHLLTENGKEIFQWLEDGAYFYVCGDKKNMAQDVEKALLDLIAKAGNLDKSKAKEYLQKLSSDGRYLKDVY
jgi:sulfite reductase (NADPH) flavoprotein alpha-component